MGFDLSSGSETDMSDFQKRALAGNASNLKKYVAAAVGSTALAGGAAMADGIDVSTIVTLIGTVATAAGLIGVAVLAMHYGIKAYKWVKAAG